MGQGGSNLAKLQAYEKILKSRPVPASDCEFWGNLFLLPQTREEVWHAFSLNLLEHLKNNQQHNFAMLITQAINNLKINCYRNKPTLVIEEPLVLNCVRILTRLVSCLLEDEAHPFVQNFVWNNQWPTQEAKKGGKETNDSASDDRKTDEGTQEEEGKEVKTNQGEEEHLKLAAHAHTLLGTGCDGFLDRRNEIHPNTNEYDRMLYDIKVGLLREHDVLVRLPYGAQIVRLLARCALAPGLCNSPMVGFHPFLVTPEVVVQPDLVWETGVELPDETAKWNKDDTGYDQNRAEVLRALLVCFGQCVYRDPRPENFGHNLWVRSMVENSNQCGPTFFYSLLNLTMSYDPSGVIPYSYSMYADYREPLVDLGLQVLLILLDYRDNASGALLSQQQPQQQPQQQNVKMVQLISGSESKENALEPPQESPPIAQASGPTRSADDPDVQASNTGNSQAVANDGQDSNSEQKEASAPSVGQQDTNNPAESVSTEGEDKQEEEEVPRVVSEIKTTGFVEQLNVFRRVAFYALHSKKDMDFIFTGLLRLLDMAHRADHTYLPYSMKKSQCYQEIFVFLWKMLDENQYFFQHVANSPEISKLISPLLYFMCEARKDQSQLGMMYTCVFILLKLSGERAFSVSLNQPATGPFPSDFPKFQGCFADLLVMISNQLITKSNDPNKKNNLEMIDALLNIILTILANVSAYIKKLALFASVRLINLFEMFSAPHFLYQNQTNQQYVILLLDVFNNVLQYQYQGNAHLVYSITRRSALFYRLTKLPIFKLKKRKQGNKKAKRKPASAPVESEQSSAGRDDEKNLVNKTDANESQHTPPSSNLPSTADKKEAEADKKGNSKTKAPKDNVVPTPQWVIDMHQRLPLLPINVMLNFFLPKIEAMCQDEVMIDDAKIIQLIQSSTLVGVLPVPHSIVVRRYIPNNFTNQWFTTYLWGVVFLRNQLIPLFDATKIKIFAVTPAMPANAQLEA